MRIEEENESTRALVTRLHVQHADDRAASAAKWATARRLPNVGHLFWLCAGLIVSAAAAMFDPHDEFGVASKMAALFAGGVFCATVLLWVVRDFSSCADERRHSRHEAKKWDHLRAVSLTEGQLVFMVGLVDKAREAIEVLPGPSRVQVYRSNFPETFFWFSEDFKRATEAADELFPGGDAGFDFMYAKELLRISIRLCAKVSVIGRPHKDGGMLLLD